MWQAFEDFIIRYFNSKSTSYVAYEEQLAYLKMELSRVNKLNNELLQQLITPPILNEEVTEKRSYEPIIPKNVGWSQKRAKLESDDYQVYLKQKEFKKNQSTEELESELKIS